MTRIVTTHYRYKRPPRRRKAVLRADKRAVGTDGDTAMRAWLLRAMMGGWPRDD